MVLIHAVSENKHGYKLITLYWTFTRAPLWELCIL